MKQNNWQVTTADARKLGVNPHLLIDLANRVKLERVGLEVYIDPAIFEDDMCLFFNTGLAKGFITKILHFFASHD